MVGKRKTGKMLKILTYGKNSMPFVRVEILNGTGLKAMQDMQEALSGVRVVRAYRQEAHQIERFERANDKGPKDQPYRISDTELASRLSFFLWSSIPDDQLLDLAVAGRLKEPAVLDAQVTRMLADPRSTAFTQNFFGQWLFLRINASFMSFRRNTRSTRKRASMIP